MIPLTDIFTAQVKKRASLPILLHITAVNLFIQKSTIFHIFLSAKTVHGRRLFTDFARVNLLSPQAFTTSTHFYSQVEQFSTSITVHWSAEMHHCKETFCLTA